MERVVICCCVVISIAAALSVTSCNTCTEEDDVLKFEQVYGHKELTEKHTFMMQACLPDEVGKVNSISYKLRYTLDPPNSTIIVATTSHKTGKVEYGSVTQPIQVFTWIEVLGAQFEKLSIAEAKNDTDKNVRVVGAECVEIRWFGTLPKLHRVYMKYSLDLWWMGIPDKNVKE